MMKKVKREGGLMSHLGTTDCMEVERRIADGDQNAKLVYDSMCLNIAKNIARCAPYAFGKIDAILLTGGIAYSQYVTEYVSARVRFIAPVIVYPGENEMLSLAKGCLRVLRGEESAHTFHRI